MLAHIEGIIADKTQDSIVIDANGVGFLLNVSSATLSLAPQVGERMKLYCTLIVREDAMELCGFYSKEEKRMYERLRGVSGIGSKTALQILSAMSVRDLSVALVTGDAAALTRVPGIGKKTAQRLLLELKDKVDDASLTGSGVAVRPGGASHSAEDEAIAALISLGYQSAEAAQAVSRVAGQADKPDELIFLALKGMGGL